NAAKSVREAPTSVAALTRDGRVTELPGIGRTLEEKIHALLETGQIPAVEKLRAKFPPGLMDLTRLPGLGPKRARRLYEDLDIAATASDTGALAAVLADLDVIESCSTPGDNAARARTHTGMAVDLRVVEPDQFGNVLQHLTGSKEHNMSLREAAVRRGLHVSEYGILDDATGVTARCATEEQVYERLGMAWIPPELREDRGELAAAAAGRLPELITLGDLRGDLHCHTVASDGRNTVEQMAQAAQARGYEYLAITDHSATHGFGDHVTPDELRAQIE